MVSPKNGWVKLNFDVSKLKYSSAALSYILKDENTKELILRAKACENAFVLVVEALAHKEAVNATMILGCKKLEIEGDNNLCVINSLKEI